MLNKQSIKTGFSFGLTSGIITTLGLIVGLHSGTNSKLAILAGVLTIAIADALSDALGIHIAEETRENRKHNAVWESTAATFFTKLVISSSFIIPLLFLSLNAAIIASILWGIMLLIIFNYYLARLHSENPLIMICEHVFITFLVIIATHYIGSYIAFLI